jgi:beta-phosphoglucomutase-like phosphatase (HAD superfamily)
MAVRAITFDFNGTLSQDEPILCGIFRELFGAPGGPLSEREYYDDLAGCSDEEIVRRWLGEDDGVVCETVAERVRVYRERIADGSTISEETAWPYAVPRPASPWRSSRARRARRSRQPGCTQRTSSWPHSTPT